MTPEEIIADQLQEEFLIRATEHEVENIIAALTAAGYAIVPVEPTEEMREAGQRAAWRANPDSGGWPERPGDTAATASYRAMITAATKEGQG